MALYKGPCTHGLPNWEWCVHSNVYGDTCEGSMPAPLAVAGWLQTDEKANAACVRLENKNKLVVCKKARRITA